MVRHTMDWRDLAKLRCQFFENYYTSLSYQNASKFVFFLNRTVYYKISMKSQRNYNSQYSGKVD